MSEENKAVIRRWTEEFDKKNFAIVEELSTPSAIFYYPGNDPWERQAQQAFFNPNFPDRTESLAREALWGFCCKTG